MDAARLRQEDRGIVIDLAEQVVERLSPDELPIFRDVADEYFRDPERVAARNPRDETLGFGVDLALVAPYALAVAGPVVQFLGGLAADLAKDTAKDLLRPSARDLVRRVFRQTKTHEEPTSGLVLSPDDIRWIRKNSYSKAIALGLPAEKAELLADAMVGCVTRS
jgi:hypothetical protein